MNRGIDNIESITLGGRVQQVARSDLESGLDIFADRDRLTAKGVDPASGHREKGGEPMILR